jgi:hypothetical protein
VAGVALLTGLLSAGVAGPAAAAQSSCAQSGECTAEEFVTQLLEVANERDPKAVAADVQRVFGSAADGTYVFVSALLPGSHNAVRRFLRVGNESYPLRLGAAGGCLTFAALDRRLAADGWSGGRSPHAGSEVWVYRKARNQLWSEPRRVQDSSGHARWCAGSMLVTFR